MINIENLNNLVNSAWWREFKKIIEEKKLNLTKKIIEKPKDEWELEILKIKTLEEMINIPENIIKKEKLKKQELNSLWKIPNSLG